jgi:hypothetical protein
MIRNTLILKILTLLITVQCGITLPMENPLGGNIPDQPANQQPDANEPKLTAQEREEILANARNGLNSMQGVNIDTKKIIDDYYADKKRREDKEDQLETDTIRWQNTILLGHPQSPVAIYNKDLATASSLLINLIAINNLNNKLHEYRVNTIFTSLTENTHEWIALFEAVEEEKEKLDQEWLEKGLFEKLLSKFQKSPYVKQQELNDRIAQEHAFIHYNPFKEELIGTLGITFATQKVASFVENQYLAKNACKEEAFCSFSKDDQGILHKHQNAFFPLSATSVVKWWFFPGLATEWNDMIPDVKKKFHHLSTDVFYGALLASIGVPQELYAILHSPITNFFIHLFSLGLGVKMLHDTYHRVWCLYMVEKQDQLIELLHAYNNVKSLPDKSDEKEAAAHALKQFIVEGNSLSILTKLNSWNTLKNQALSSLNFYRSLPLVGIVTWKWRNEIAEQLGRFMNRVGNNNNNDNN